MSKNRTQEDIEGGLDLAEKVQRPSLYKVVLLNDDFTPMDFVIFILKTFFGKSDQEATEIMMKVHNEGSGVAGVYPFEIAEMKSAQVNTFAKENQHPLKSVIEKE